MDIKYCRYLQSLQVINNYRNKINNNKNNNNINIINNNKIIMIIIKNRLTRISDNDIWINNNRTDIT